MNSTNTLTNLTPEQDRLTRLLAARYLRQENRFYHIDQPTQALSRRDVEQTFMNMVGRELPDIALTVETMKTVFRVGIELQHTDQNRSIPVWGGQLRSYPGEAARLVWNPNGTVAINTWRKPEYRQRGVNRARYGHFGPLFRTLFPNPKERRQVLDWVAWTLQNENDRPSWSLLLYSKAKGTGKSTFCDVLKQLHGIENSTTQNNVDSLVARFNAQVLTSRLVVCEELSLRSESKQANALKTYITDTETLTERKGREAESTPLISCFVFTTNHLPTWMESGERRYFVVQTDHDGHSSGPRAADFSAVVAGVYEALANPDEVAALFNALMHRRVSVTFNPKSLNTERDGTAIMRQLLGTSGETILDQLSEYLADLGLHVVPQATVQEYITKDLRQNGNRTRHMMQELGWTQTQVKWGGKDYARALWMKPGFHVADGNIVRPDGTAEAIAAHLSKEDFN
ncbi:MULTISPECIES: primase-helicase family protein [unclassified Yoonia]|uniref:primase-helicase family protein n=1 Tax=unclassified Yoonia TaxID=2629118 RepID=UPI002AFF8AAD|nr:MULTISPECIES: primase-helicase family protein [unclassified Yoonia]